MSARPLLLLAACAGLAALAVTREAPVLPPPPGAGTAAGGYAPVAALPEPPRGPWAEQVARPLFAQDRRPPVLATPVATRREPEPPPPLAAAGIVLQAGVAVALLRLPDDRVVRVAVGDEVGGWQVSRIADDGVLLTRGSRSVTLNARIASAGGLSRIP
ncbi:hypothetical protein [Muricoccus vinaceus]|uniref:Pilus assembly protein PilP n=1 Tax=Muricoccus vinaceus TaxID=424704 RepID=A0ABV6J098_9PROT